MEENMEKRYKESFARYVIAMNNGKPDRVPIRIFAAEFVAKYSGYTIQEITHQYEKAFDATIKCASDFEWDATVINMVYVWAGLVDSLGLKYYKIPGIGLDENTGFQYLEPSEEEDAYMKADEYDLLIENPTMYLANVWIPRVSNFMTPAGEPNNFKNNITWLKGGIAMMKYFSSFGPAIERMKNTCGTVPAIAGILKAPFDILADKLRGFRQLSADIYRRPEKVLKAVEALAPHLLRNAIASSDPNKQLPVGLWLHRGTLFSAKIYEKFFWPTLKYIITELWKEGLQTLWYGEGDWNKWLEYTRELPDKSIIYHVDKEDIFEAHKVLGEKFCISGGIPNDLLAFGTPEDIKDCCKKIIKTVGKDGGYILDASAIIQNDAKVENIRALTESVKEFGNY